MNPHEIADRVELRALVDEYAHCADQRDFARFAELFTEDGELSGIRPGDDTPFFRATGRAELVDVVHGNDGFPRTFHFVGNHHCTIGETGATGVTYCTAHHLRADDADTEAIVWLIRYLDEYARTTQGWRFADRKIEVVWVEYLDSDTSAFPFRKGWPGA